MPEGEAVTERRAVSKGKVASQIAAMEGCKASPMEATSMEATSMASPATHGRGTGRNECRCQRC